MTLWLRLSANFHEHPKMLYVRAQAKGRADSAELGWYRILMAAKRYGRWSFASEEHLAHVAGPYYRFVPIYREARLLDDLTVHDGDSYNAVKTPAERKAEQRERDRVSREGVTNERDMPRDQSVTLEERDRESREKEERETPAVLPSGEDRDALDLYHELTGYRPWGQWSGDKLKGAISEYGNDRVEAAMRAEWDASHDRKSLLDGMLARLARDADRRRTDAERKRLARLAESRVTPEQAAENVRRRNEIMAEMLGRKGAA